MEIGAFLDKAVAGVPLLFVVLGIVEFFKKLKDRDGYQLYQGNDLLIISMVWGLVLGSCYMLSTARPPAGTDLWICFGYWFAIVFYGFALGLVASGFYDTVKNLVTKIFLDESK